MFNVWYPHVSDSICVRFDVTPRDTALVNEGTSRFVSSCLESCGISSPMVEQWKVTCIRQTYYGDYPDSPDWRARWDLAWTFEVILAEKITTQISFEPFPFTTDMTDASSSEDREPSMALGPALVAACFKNFPGTEHEIEHVVSEWSRRHAVEGSLRTRFDRYDNGYLHVRVLIGGINFPEQIQALDTLNRSVRESGGITDWRGLVAKS